MNRLYFLACLLVTTPVLGASKTKDLTPKSELHGERYDPWFSGTLLAPAGHTLPPGIAQIKPQLFASDGMGSYGFIWQNRCVNKTRTVNPVLTLGYGLLSYLDIEASFQGYYKELHGKHSYRRGDISLALGVQVLTQRRNTAMPDLKLIVMENFPFGFYKDLNPNKNGTDSSGSGSWETSIGLVVSKLFHTKGVHFINFSFTAGYTHAHQVSVTSFNTYGGGYGTDAIVHPKRKWLGILSLEFAITQNLSLAADIYGTAVQSAKVEGTYGVDASGATATFNTNDFYQVSFAPALEWNFSKNTGLSAGVWYSLLGRSDAEFFSGVLSLNIKR